MTEDKGTQTDDAGGENWLDELFQEEPQSTDKLEVPKKFKAEDQEVELESSDKALEFIRKGMNYEKKMEAIRPHRQLIELVQNDPVAKEWLQERANSLIKGEQPKGDKEAEEEEAPAERAIDPKVYEISLRSGLGLSLEDYEAVKGKLIEMVLSDKSLTKGEKAAINYDPDTYEKYFKRVHASWVKEKGGKAGTKPVSGEEPPYVLAGGEKETPEVEASEANVKAKKIWELPRDKFLEKVSSIRDKNLG